MNAAALIATHLNAPVGQVVQEQDVLASLQEGSLSAATEQANALLSYLFVEIDPRLILQCAEEAGASASDANRLYADTIAHNSPRCVKWESSLEFLL